MHAFGGIWMKSSCFPVLISARITAFHALHTFVRKMGNRVNLVDLCHLHAIVGNWSECVKKCRFVWFCVGLLVMDVK